MVCIETNWSLSRSFREASGGPFRAMGPAAKAVGARSLFLDSPRNRGKNRPKAFPLGEPPTPGASCARSSARMRHWCADSALPARAPPQSVFAPFRSHARGYVPRRDGRHSLSVLPETGSRLSHSRSRSQAATADCLPSARRREEFRHAGGIPKGRALWSLLPTSGEAEVGPRREQKELYKLQFTVFLPLRRLLYQITFPSSTPEIRRLCRIDRKRPDFFHSTH